LRKKNDKKTGRRRLVVRSPYISLAADLGYSEPTIAALVGHKGQSITSRYIHSADAMFLAAADILWPTGLWS
jgi:integrase